MRGKKAPRHDIAPDAIHGSPLVTKLTNYVMESGKKTIAEKIVYKALEDAGKAVEAEPLDVLNKVIENVGPVMEVRAKRIGGANYQIPYEVTRERKLILAYRWILNAARNRKGMPMSKRLTLELIDAYKGEGAAMKKREDTHKMADSNRAFAHFARF